MSKIRKLIPALSLFLCLVSVIAQSAENRVGFYRGTFDPPHLGHAGLIRGAIESLKLDTVYVLVNAKPEWKPNASAFSHRHAMAKIAFEKIPGVVIFMPRQCEDLADGSYLELVREFAAFQPEDQFYFLFGEDRLPSYRERCHPSALTPLPNLHMAVCPRQESHQITPDFIEVFLSRFNSSSTDCRNQLVQGLPSDGIDSEVLQYIKTHKLYFNQ